MPGVCFHHTGLTNCPVSLLAWDGSMAAWTHNKTFKENRGLNPLTFSVPGFILYMLYSPLC
uniref:Uncharacterized protein n=1 Tax=Anguilla anguilla TaxID=7936 RepID=A0A0E9PT41_ANGAN